MIGVWLGDGQHHLLAVRVGNIRIGCQRKASDDGVACQVGVVHVEMALLRIARWKRDAEQAALATAADAARDVQEGSSLQRAIL